MLRLPIGFVPLVVERVMTSAEESEHYARECMRIAGATGDRKLREQLIEMARRWMALLMDSEGESGAAPGRASDPRMSIHDRRGGVTPAGTAGE
jgi:hypothetical protein